MARISRLARFARLAMLTSWLRCDVDEVDDFGGVVRVW